MNTRMAPSTDKQQGRDLNTVERRRARGWEQEINGGRGVRNLRRRQNKRFFGDFTGRILSEGKRAAADDTSRLDPLGIGKNFEQAASSASKAFNDFFNPTKQASPDATSSAAPVDTPAEAAPTTDSSPAPTAPPTQPSPTSQPAAPPAPPPQRQPEAVPSSTNAPVAPPAVTSSVAATTAPALPTAPAVAAPVEIVSSSLVQKEPLAATTANPALTMTGGVSRSITSTSNSVTPVANATPSVIRGSENWKPDNGNSMAPVAQRLATAAGVIGALIFIMVVFLLILRVRRGETLAMFVRRKSPKYGSRVFPTRSRPVTGPEYYPEPPPKYSSAPEAYEYAAVEKSVPSQRQLNGFYTPGPLPPLTIPRATAAPNFYSPQRQGQEVSPLTPNGQQPTSSQGQRSHPDVYYSISPQSSHQQISNLNEVFIQNGLYQGPSTSSPNNFSTPRGYDNANRNANQNFIPNTYNNITSPSTQVSMVSGSYNNTGTQNTFLTMETSNLNASSPQEANRVSTLSSLSSGFGDGLIIIQDTDSIKYTNPQPQRESRRQRTTRFSWQTTNSKAPASDRTSVYTAASVESAPRFRSVNSWVAQQSTRLERQQMMAANIPAMPPIPTTLQQSVAPVKHTRQESDISAFNYHPGQEVRIAPGSRVASSVLDKKIGHMSRSTLG